MHQFEVSRVVDHDPARVWAVLDRFADTYVYHPIVESSSALNGVEEGLGAERVCNMYGGGSVKERVVAHDAANRRYDVEVFDFGSMPLRKLGVTVSVTAEGPRRARVTFAGGFEPRFGPAGWVMAKVMMKRQFERMMGQVIDGLAAHLETGREIQKGGALGPAVVAA